MLTRIRFDDVLWAADSGKNAGKELERFKLHLGWCQGLDVSLSPAILCQEMAKFPDGLEYLKTLLEDDRVTLDLHGWDHGPYAPRTQVEVEEHLRLATEWFDEKFSFAPLRWVTPHGANSWAMKRAAAKFGLTIETTEYPVVDQRQADKWLRESRDVKVLDGAVIMVHWWERGMALHRIAKIAMYGNVPDAIIASKQELTDDEWRACWGEGWHKK